MIHGIASSRRPGVLALVSAVMVLGSGTPALAQRSSAQPTATRGEHYRGPVRADGQHRAPVVPFGPFTGTSPNYVATDVTLAVGMSNPAITFQGPHEQDNGTVWLPEGSAATLWMRGTRAVDIVAQANGAGVWSKQDDRWFPAEGPWPWFSPPTLVLGTDGTLATYHVQWSMGTGPQKIEVRTQAGVLELSKFLLHGPAPSVLLPAAAAALPVLSVFGDSIADGAITGGPYNDSNGWADRLTASIGWRLSQASTPGVGAVNWGVGDTGRVIASGASVVVVAWGHNDITGGFYRQPATLDQFETAMASILDTVHAGLPFARVYAASILPWIGAGSDTAPEWNAALAQLAPVHGAEYVDQTAILTLPGDLADGTHPNAAGHAKIATFWSYVETSSAGSTSPTIEAPNVSPLRARHAS